ncbi:thioesterase family protein [Pseudomonadota bacterium]|nr:thioesterase family protein [Pseudomonadota bacterium]
MSFFKQFENSIAIDRLDENLFSMTPSKDYFVGNTPHGGYLTALMQKAISLSMPHPHLINSNTLYLDRTEPREISIKVEKIRESRGSSVGQVSLIQDNKLRCMMTGICSDFHYMNGVNDLETHPPKIFSEERDSFISLNFDNKEEGITPSFIKQTQCEIAIKHAWWLKNEADLGDEARCSGFISMGDEIPDQFVLSFYSDFFPPVVMNKYGPLGWVPTLSLTTNIRQLPTTSELFMDVIAKDLNKGFFEQDCQIWDLNKNLVATSRQLTRILKSEEKLPHLTNNKDML